MKKPWFAHIYDAIKLNTKRMVAHTYLSLFSLPKFLYVYVSLQEHPILLCSYYIRKCLPPYLNELWRVYSRSLREA